MENIVRPDEAFVALVAREIADANARIVEMHRKVHRCRGCGVPIDEKTPGCKTCYMRHYEREHRSSRNREKYNDHKPQPHFCVGCGIPWNDHTPGCTRCKSRHAMRRLMAERKAMA